MLVFLWCQLAAYLFADECAAVSPQLAVLMYRYPFEAEQKLHMLAWLAGEHAIRPVLFSDWNFKPPTPSLAALCLHLAMSRF